MGPKDREERQLMRQRGAGTRQVKNISFDLVLPGQESTATEPPRPIQSGRSRKTPQPELPPQRSSRRTPKPEKIQVQRSLRKTPATEFTKKRGRPAKQAITENLEDLSTSRATQADEGIIPARKRKTGKAQREEGDVAVPTAPEVQGDEIGTLEVASSAAPSTGVKKRKKRKSIGQQSTSRAKTAKERNPLKQARQPRKRRPRPDLAEAIEVTDLDRSLAKEVPTGSLVDAVPLDGGQPAHLPKIVGVLDPGTGNDETSAEKLQQDVAQKSKKRKQGRVEELPKKRVKTSSTLSKRAPKAPKTRKETVATKDTLDADQSLEKPAEVDTGSLGYAEEQEAAPDVAEPRKQKPKKRKRVTVGQQPKKRAKAGITRIHREPKAPGESSTAEDLFATQSVGKPAEVEGDLTSQTAEDQEATTKEAESETQKPKRKKRKSIGQQKPKKKSVDLTTPDRTARKTAASNSLATRDGLNNKRTSKRGRPKIKQAPEEAIEELQAESLGHVPEEEGGIKPSETEPNGKSKARRGRPKAKPNSEDALDKSGGEARRHTPDAQEEVQPPVLPKKKKRGRPRKADAAHVTSQSTRPMKAPSSRKPRAKAASTTAPKARAPPKNSIPITIYAPPTPTSSDAEDDPLSTSQTHIAPNTVNSVDVLAQVCSEFLSQSSSALAEQAHSEPSASKQSELKRTKHTTDLYAEELASRLLQLTTTLNTNTSLRSRVRAAAKEERGLKKELKQLEKEREDIKVRKEEVMKERKKEELEELLSGIAGAVKRGWDMQKEGGEAGDAVAGMAEESNLEV